MQTVILPQGTLVFFSSRQSKKLFPTIEDMVRRHKVQLAHADEGEMPLTYLAAATPKDLKLADLTSVRSSQDNGYYRRLNRRFQILEWFAEAGADLAVDGRIIRSDGLTSGWTQFDTDEPVFEAGDVPSVEGLIEFNASSPSVSAFDRSLVAYV